MTAWLLDWSGTTPGNADGIAERDSICQLRTGPSAHNAEYFADQARPAGQLRCAQIVHYGAAHHRLRDRQIMSPVVLHTSLCRPNCANGSVAASTAGRFATYSPWARSR